VHDDSAVVRVHNYNSTTPVSDSDAETTPVKKKQKKGKEDDTTVDLLKQVLANSEARNTARMKMDQS
jgi:hypothetical protein